MPVLFRNIENRFHLALKCQFCTAILTQNRAVQLLLVAPHRPQIRRQQHTYPLSSTTTPEGAALLLLSITQQQPPPRLNLSFPLIDVYCSRDRRIKSILQSGMMLTINWKTVKKELTFELGRFLHRKIKAHFDFVDSSCNRQQKQWHPLFIQLASPISKHCPVNRINV